MLSCVLNYAVIAVYADFEFDFLSYTSWAGQDAQNRPISLCSAQFFEFGLEILTRDSEQARRDTTWRAQKNKNENPVDFSSIS